MIAFSARQSAKTSTLLLSDLSQIISGQIPVSEFMNPQFLPPGFKSLTSCAFEHKCKPSGEIVLSFRQTAQIIWDEANPTPVLDVRYLPEGECLHIWARTKNGMNNIHSAGPISVPFDISNFEEAILQAIISAGYEEIFSLVWWAKAWPKNSIRARIEHARGFLAGAESHLQDLENELAEIRTLNEGQESLPPSTQAEEVRKLHERMAEGGWVEGGSLCPEFRLNDPNTWPNWAYNCLLEINCMIGREG